MAALLVSERLEADVAVLGCLLALVAGGVVPLKEAFAGFANSAVLTVGFLFVVAAAVERTGALEAASGLLFGDGKRGLRTTLTRTLFPVAAISTVLNNVPLVAVLIPAAKAWCRRHGIPISQVLMPLSVAAMLGGMCTLIGTSTNLLVSGMLEARGHASLGFWEPAGVGLVLACACIITVIATAPALLPKRGDVVTELGERTREFIAELRVTSQYPYVGRTIEEAGLRHLAGLFLFQIGRGTELVAPVAPHERLSEGDRLFFTGVPDTLWELQQTAGLSAVADREFDPQRYNAAEHGLFEVVLSAGSPLLGRTVRDSGFRGTYDAVILAIHRHGERLASKIGDVTLRAGDTLLLLARRGFHQRWQHSPHFYLVSPRTGVAGRSGVTGTRALWVAGAMVLVMALGLVPPLMAAAVAAVVMVATGCVPAGDARRAVQWKVLVVLAASLGVGLATERSGLAGVLAGVIHQYVAPSGTWPALAVLFVLTNGLSLLVSNKAAVAMFLPVALATAERMAVDPRPFALVVAFAASTGFMTPLGAQTHLLVEGPGNYRFADFVRVGLPPTVVAGALVVTLLGWMQS